MALIRGNALGKQIDSAYGLRASLQRHVVSIASQAEVNVLADRHSWGEGKREALGAMFEQLVVVAIDGQAILDAYVKISAADSNWPKGPRNMGKNDVWIAATALYTGLPLLTTDKDFLFLDNNPLKVLWVNPDGRDLIG